MAQPFQNPLPQLFRELDQLGDIIASGAAHAIIFNRVPLYSAGVEVINIRLAVVAEDQRQGCDRSIVLESFLGPVT